VSWYGDPDGLDQLAVQLSSAAARVRDRAYDVRSASSSARWRGPAADAFRTSVSRESGSLERAAAELDDAAAALHGHAEAVRAEIARLVAIERAAERLVSTGLAKLGGLLS
jgi:uncharacterized protein YukE